MTQRNNNSWITGPLTPKLDHNVIHVWRLVLPIPENIIKKFQRNLSYDELLRLEKFNFDVHKIKFIAARGCLRDILARYLNQSPKNINFTYNNYGKPHLSYSDFYFNVSHSGNCVLYAITKKASIGIDIEELRYDIDVLTIAQQFFSKNEYIKLLSIPPNERYLAFYRCWTRKEAYLKAIGKGLSYPLNEIEVNFLPFEKPIISKTPNSQEKIQWQLEEIITNKDYIAVIITQLKYNQINLWNWENTE